jgi:hypothetical protein
MPKRRSMSGSVSQLHVRLSGRWSRYLCQVNIDEFIDNLCVNGQCLDGVANYTCQMSNRVDRMAVSFAYWKCSKIKFFNFWLVISDVMRISTNANRILVRTTRRAIIWSAYTFAIVQKISSASIARSARRHLRQRALPQQRQLHGSLRRIDFAGQQLPLPLSVWLWWNQLRESHQLLFRSRSLS